MSSSTPSPVSSPASFVTFNLLRCDVAELTVLRDLFRHRQARCLHLTGAVPLESVPALENEAESHAADARRVELALAAQIAADTARRASYAARALEARDERAFQHRLSQSSVPARDVWPLDGEIDGHNLDGFACPDELRTHGDEMREKGAPHAYADYCREKARAMEFRVKGWVNSATVCERNCEKFYEKLPKDWQW